MYEQKIEKLNKNVKNRISFMKHAMELEK